MEPPTILKVPVEIIVKVFRHLDLESALNFALVNRYTQEIFVSHREGLILLILETELSPFDALLQHIVSSPDDFNIRYGPCLRRSIYHGNKLLSKGESPEPGPEESLPHLPAVMLDHHHFQSLIRIHRTVKDWEQYYPQYRFRSDPSSCRQLRPQEAQRLRRALYHWMSFAYYFHGDAVGSNRSVLWFRDIRVRKLRLLTSPELVELCDLWARVRTMVRCDICPSTEHVLRDNDYKISVDEAENLSFGGTSVHSAIVNTFSKLAPDEILHLATERFAHSRTQVIRQVRLAHPKILVDQESFSLSLQLVAHERLVGPPPFFALVQSTDWLPLIGGILDCPGYVRSDMEASQYLASSQIPPQRTLDWLQEEDMRDHVVAVLQKGRLEP